MSGHNAQADMYKSPLIKPDPGDAGTIRHGEDFGAIVELVTSGAETRTLADPDKAGVELFLSMKTDGGDCVVTASSAINTTGNNTITFANTGETLMLKSVNNNGSFVWREIGGDAGGPALSTV